MNRKKQGKQAKQEKKIDDEDDSPDEDEVVPKDKHSANKKRAEDKRLEEQLEYNRFPSIMGWYFDGFSVEPFGLKEQWAIYFNDLQENIEAIEEFESNETFTEKARRNFWPPTYNGPMFRTRGIYLDFKEVIKDPPRTPPEINFDHERKLIGVVIQYGSDDEPEGSLAADSSLDTRIPSRAKVAAKPPKSQLSSKSVQIMETPSTEATAQIMKTPTTKVTVQVKAPTTKATVQMKETPTSKVTVQVKETSSTKATVDIIETPSMNTLDQTESESSVLPRVPTASILQQSNKPKAKGKGRGKPKEKKFKSWTDPEYKDSEGRLKHDEPGQVKFQK